MYFTAFTMPLMMNRLVQCMEIALHIITLVGKLTAFLLQFGRNSPPILLLTVQTLLPSTSMVGSSEKVA